MPNFLLVSAPSPHNYNTARCNAIAAYARENDIAYLNLNDTANPVGIDWSKDCLDKGDHLNASGAERGSASIWLPISRKTMICRITEERRLMRPIHKWKNSTTDRE